METIEEIPAEVSPTLETVPMSFWHITEEEAEAIGQCLPRFGEEMLGEDF